MPGISAVSPPIRAQPACLQPVSYTHLAFGLEMKADATPVTLADRAAEAAIRAILDVERPEEGIIGEEYGSTREGASRVWVLDPIDGTRSFVGGRPIFGTLIALIEEGVPILGLIDQPISGERWIGAAGQGTLFNGAPANTRKCAALAHAVQATTSPAAFSADHLRAFERLIPATRDTLYGGDCYNYGLVAIGQIDIVVESGLKVHDFAALVPVVEGAGGIMRDWQGKPLTSTSEGHVIACGDAELLPHILERLNA